MNAPKLRYRYAHTLLTCAIGMVSLNATAAALLRAIRTTLQRTSPGAGRDAQLGAVSFLHRFGSALNPHFHVVVLDGLFAEDDGGAITFHEATHFCAADVHRLQRTLQRRVLRLFERRGLLDARTVADMLTWQASGGFSLDASVRIHGTDSAGRERLLRYCARPPFALERLRIERHSDAQRSRYRYPKPPPKPLQLLTQIELAGELQDQRALVRPARQARALHRAVVLDVVVDQEQSRAGRTQPAEAHVAREVARLVVVLE